MTSVKTPSPSLNYQDPEYDLKYLSEVEIQNLYERIRIRDYDLLHLDDSSFVYILEMALVNEHYETFETTLSEGFHFLWEDTLIGTRTSEQIGKILDNLHIEEVKRRIIRTYLFFNGFSGDEDFLMRYLELIIPELEDYESIISMDADVKFENDALNLIYNEYFRKKEG